MLSRLLRETLFALVHLVVNLLVAVQNVYHRFWIEKYNNCCEEVTKTDIQMLLKHVPRMSKKVKHLVVVADTDHHSMKELACVVIWTLIAGIPHLSFHDITGELKENEGKFFLEVERRKKGIPGCIKWSNKPNLNGYTNGIPANSIVVKIFTQEDGRTHIADCIKHIAEGRLPCKRSSAEITAQELHDVLALTYPSFPDPDLVLFMGPSCRTNGLLPWQIRLTEFIQMSTSYCVNIDNYIGALYKYSKCDQRFGK